MTTSTPPVNLTPKLVRAARALLAWSQQDLAKAAGIAVSTVADFERGYRSPIAKNAEAIRDALEGADIHFLPTGAVIGPAIPTITASSHPGIPIRWVTAEDLSDWANRTDGTISLPTLLANLIRATHGPGALLRFPADEGVRYPGWDGRTSVDTGSAYVPQGDAGWEIGAQRNNIAQKATEDYQKRVATPSPFNPATATYIFVTPRHWPKKDEWASARKAEGVWRDVRAYDADDLVHWIEQTPAVGLWLATRLNKRPSGTRELDEIWEEWSLATQWPLSADLVLCDRDQDATEVHRWLRGDPSMLSLQATTTDEVVAFFHATLSELPEDLAAAYRARCLVTTTAAAARAITSAPAPLILILTDPEPGLAQTLVARGHYVLQAYDDRPIGRGEVRALARPSREGIANALEAAGISKPRAEALARDSARNLSVLRRLIPSAPGRLPRWAKEQTPNALLAALLAGGWDERVDADRSRLADIANQPYDDVIAALASYVGDFDSPLQKIGSTWRMASPSDAWFLLASNLTNSDIIRFEAAAIAVLSSADPRFQMDSKDRWMAGVRGINRDYSDLLRHGIGQTLILLALWGNKVHTVPNAEQRAEAVVRKLLQDADGQRWWSLSRDFRLLAEASPSAFLTAIEDSLDQDTPPIGALFGHDEGGIFGAEHLSNLMWALESLAWSPDWMPRVTHILARLDSIDTKPRRFSKGPANSLREIHLLWLPQTYAMLKQRLRALDLIRKREANAAWKLMLQILPKGHDTSSPSPMPRWRDFTIDKVEVVTWGLIAQGAAAISERLLNDVGLSTERWVQLLDRLSDLAPGPEAALAALDKAEPAVTHKTDRSAFWHKLRSILHHHRQYLDAEWSLPETILDQLEIIYHRFAPTDALQQISWLFEQSVSLPNPTAEGWEAEQREVDKAQQQAIQNLYANGGTDAVLSLARQVNTAGYIGRALYASGLPIADIDAVLEAAVRSENDRERDVAHGIIVSAFRERKEPWADALIYKAEDEAWGDTALLTIFRALPVQPSTWGHLFRIGKAIERAYWCQAPILWIAEDADSVSLAIHMLLRFGRARSALALAGHNKKVGLTSDLLIEVLTKAADQSAEGDDDANDATMFQHYVAEIMQILDQRNDVDQSALAVLEWKYLQVLEYSRRPAKVLLKTLASEPKLFVEMLSAVYKPSEESGIPYQEPADPEQAQLLASQAYHLLDLWNYIPGTRDNGTIDPDVLETWIKDARYLAKEVGQQDIADNRIGNMLSASPVGSDGNWPAEAVREVLDLFRSKRMITGFIIGKSNRRGVTTRMPRDGGKLEREEAAKYRAWAKAIAFDHPHTAKALDRLAEDYEQEAQWHDEDAQRLDWQS